MLIDYSVTNFSLILGHADVVNGRGSQARTEAEYRKIVTAQNEYRAALNYCTRDVHLNRVVRDYTGAERSDNG